MTTSGMSLGVTHPRTLTFPLPPPCVFGWGEKTECTIGRFTHSRSRREPKMPKTAKFHADLRVTPMLANESLYVGIDVGKLEHVAGFVSNTLIKRHERFEACPVLKFEQSREGFRQLIDRIQGFCPLEQCYVLLEKTGHYHKALEQYLLELDISVYIMHVQERP